MYERNYEKGKKMKLKSLIFVVFILTSSLFASEINWAKDFDSGIAEATKTGKPVLFVFSSHSCHYCRVLDSTTFEDKKVIEALNRDYVPIISYTDEGDYTPRQLYSPGTPTMWFLNSDGTPLFQPLRGAVDAPNFLKALTIVTEEFQKISGK